MNLRMNSGIAVIVLAAILWGTTGTAQAFAPVGAQPLAIGMMRMMVGGLAMTLIALLKNGVQPIAEKKYLVLAGLCMASYQPFFFSGVMRAGVAVGTLIAIGSAPIFSGMIDLFSGNHLRFQWKLSTIISLIGCVLLTGLSGNERLDLLGIAYALVAGLSYAVYVKASQRMFRHGSNELANGLVFLLAGILLLPFVESGDMMWVVSWQGSLILLHLGLVTTAAAYTLFARGLRHVDSPTAVTLSLVEPLTAALLGLFVLREPIQWLQALGLLVMLMGLAVNSNLVYEFFVGTCKRD